MFFYESTRYTFSLRMNLFRNKNVLELSAGRELTYMLVHFFFLLRLVFVVGNAISYVFLTYSNKALQEIL